jgi:two-component system, cell cycle sensor histidine kinase and response regulator CckA
MKKNPQKKNDQGSSLKMGSGLRKEKELHRILIENINEGIWVIDKVANTSFVNACMAEMLGYTSEEMIGSPLFSFMDKKAVTIAEQMIARRQKGIKESHDFEFVKKDGKRIWTSLGASPLFDKDGNYAGAIAGVQDITQRKRMERELAESETRYRELLELESDAVFLIDNETGGILEVNNAAIALYGYSREELLAKKNSDLSAEPEKTKEITRQTAAYSNRIVQVPIRYHRKKDGTVFPIEITGRFFMHHGKPVHIAAIRDIIERKQNEEALYSSQNMLQVVLDTIPVAVFWKDRDFHYLGGNRTWLDAVGIQSSEAVIGKSDYDLPWEKAQADSFRQDDKRVMESGSAEYNIVEPYLRADGTHAWARTNKVPLRDADGNVMGVLGTYEDITERKRMEEELYKAQKLESLSLLAGGIAHDFNNLMGGIFGHIDLALASSKDGSVSKYLSAAIGAIDRARNLTGQLLTFAKGGAPIREIGALSPVIRDSSKLALSGSNVSCAYTIQDGLWLCNFDKNQISQVIDNIVINAREAMPMGGAILISAMNISLKANEKGTLHAGNYVKISLHDDGIGIPEDMLPKIFDPFFTTKHRGSGLGLSICHSIVKRHDGWIDVESAPGKGATFHLYLPASVEASAMAPSGKPVSFHRGSGRILIMDDEELIRQSVGNILTTLGYSVECRRDGKETVAFLTEEIKAGRSFAAILLDLTIPGGMGGKEVAVEIKKLNSEIPLFVTSGYSNDPVMSSPNEYGFTDSICKPFTINDVAAMLNRHMRKNP